MSNPESDLILLTGATGFVGSHVLDILIKQDYQIIVTIRNKDQELKLKQRYENYLRYQNTDRLAFVQVEDITRDNCFDMVLKFNPNITHVIHLATPKLQYNNNNEKIFDPLIKSNTNIISAIHNYGHSIELLLIGSCFAAMINNISPRLYDPRKIYSSRDVNLISKDDSLLNEYNAYLGSKTFAETYAWKYYSDLLGPHFSMICITLPMIFGPVIDHGNIDNDSVQHFTDLFKNSSHLSNFPFPFYIDVRDAALAYVKAIQLYPYTTNRWFVATNNISSQQVVDIIHKNFPKSVENILPKGIPGNGDKELLKQCSFDTSDSDDLVNITYTKLETTIIDMFNSLSSTSPISSSNN